MFLVVSSGFYSCFFLFMIVLFSVFFVSSFGATPPRAARESDRGGLRALSDSQPSTGGLVGLLGSKAKVGRGWLWVEKT